MDRSSLSLYAVAAGAVFLFYLGPYRGATTRMQMARAEMARNRSIVAEDRAILRRASSLRALQLRVSDALHSSIQVGSSGSEEAGFLERLRMLAMRYNVTILSLAQGVSSPTDRDARIFKSRALRISAKGQFASTLQFLASLDSRVGLFDFDRIEMRPITGAHAHTKADIRLRLDGSTIQILDGKER